MILVLYDLIK